MSIENTEVDDPLPYFDSQTVKSFRDLRSISMAYTVLNLPDIVFHYTSQTGLLEIAKSRVLFATHLSHLNDTQEFKFGASVFLQRLESTRRPKSPYAQYLYNRIVEVLRSSATILTVIDQFATSFCAAGDLLSMWRGYGSQGYCIGFNTKDLLCETATKSGKRERDLANIEPVLYDRTSQDNAVDNFLQASFEFASSYRSDAFVPADIPEEDLLSILWGSFFMATTELISLLKHPSFKEEQEYRLLFYGLPQLPYSDVEVRKGAMGLIRHVNVKPYSKAAFSFHSVRIGPNPQPEIAKSAVRALLSNYGHSDADILSSSVPLRW